MRRTARKPAWLEGAVQGSSSLLPAVMGRQGVIQADLIQSSQILGSCLIPGARETRAPFCFLLIVARLCVIGQLWGDHGWVCYGVSPFLPSLPPVTALVQVASHCSRSWLASPSRPLDTVWAPLPVPQHCCWMNSDSLASWGSPQLRNPPWL